MDPTSHGMWGYLVYRKLPGVKQFVLGTIMPDIPFILGALLLIIEQKTFPDDLTIQVIIDQRIAMVGIPLHSFVVWGGFTLIALTLSRQVLPFALGWGFHLILDTLTHISDATPLFWPLSPERYHGLISYWELDHYSWLFNLTNVTLLTVTYVYLIYRYLKANRRKLLK